MARPRNSALRPEDTRMQRDRLQAEAEAEQQARSAELSMASAQQNANDLAGIYDGQNGDLLEEGMAPGAVEDLVRSQLGGLPEEDEIVDATSGRPLTPVSKTTRTDVPDFLVEDSVEEAQPEAQGRRPGLRTAPEDEKMAEEVPEERGPGGIAARRPVEVQRADRAVVVRINADLDPTIGQGNQWHFKKGKRYRVPYAVAQHLHEKGYVAAWG